MLKHSLVWTIMSINFFSTPGCMVMPAAAEMCLITLICCCWLCEGSVAFAQNVLVSPCLPHGTCKKITYWYGLSWPLESTLSPLVAAVLNVNSPLHAGQCQHNSAAAPG